MRRKTAREILADSFLELAETRPVDKITIQDIVENCGYSPATFYRQYRDKYDLIAWIHTQGVAAIMSRIDQNGYTWRQTLEDGVCAFLACREYLANLFQHTEGHDSFVGYMTRINQRALKEHILKMTGQDTLDAKTELYISVYCAATVGLTCEWICGKHDLTPEELAEAFANLVPVPLRGVLLE